MERLLESLERLSEAAYEALPLLEKHDYRKEADDYANKKLEVDLMPKLLQDIVGSMLMYCAPIELRILTILTPILMMLTPSKRAGLSKSSHCLLANRQRHSRKVITFSFS